MASVEPAWASLPHSERMRRLTTSESSLTPEERAMLPPPLTDEELSRILKKAWPDEHPVIRPCWCHH